MTSVATTVTNQKWKIASTSTRPYTMTAVHRIHSHIATKGWVAVELPGPDVVQDDRDEEQDERGRDDGIEDVLELVGRELVLLAGQERTKPSLDHGREDSRGSGHHRDAGYTRRGIAAPRPDPIAL